MRGFPLGYFSRFDTLTANGTESVDDLTENWPVKDVFKSELNKIKYKFEACPLPVYAGDRFIRLKDVHAMMKGALVAVHFELKHFYIKGKKEDSFNATVQQIDILQPGKARPANAFKRRNVEDGPVRRNPFEAGLKTSQKETENEGNSRIGKEDNSATAEANVKENACVGEFSF